eukprot:NODE_1334_length_900_cov_96.469599_g1288_i0.p1 GENE.NODE_1334_length_900_cov_96.469599_g1288_i0~~NODE_1334_length_900_cov_96.469599_g1288_i0.p1  ORF type:complete len:186 (-),score=52.65 NODE_1334_length_900_cov_96.469599_g1288_i0:204-761(-)
MDPLVNCVTAPELFAVFKKQYGRDVTEAERQAVSRYTSARDIRRLAQMIQYSEEQLDLTKISLPSLPADVGDDKIYDEPLHPMAWKKIAHVCGSATQKSNKEPAGGDNIPDEFTHSVGVNFRSVPEHRANVQQQQQERHSRLDAIAAERKAKRMERLKAQTEQFSGVAANHNDLPAGIGLMQGTR